MMSCTHKDDEDVATLKVKTDVGDVRHDQHNGFLCRMELADGGCTLLLRLIAIELQCLDAM